MSSRTCYDGLVIKVNQKDCLSYYQASCKSFRLLDLISQNQEDSFENL